MRVTLFTDTLGDVNGVSRFVQNIAGAAGRTGRDLHVVTSTRFQTPAWPNIFNFVPRCAMKVPRYENLEVVLPRLGAMLRHVRRYPPEVIHISTPGPVGMVGLLAARMLKVPVLGVYHTDFPAYVDHLFDDRALTWITAAVARAFYAPFRRIFTRSEDYARSLAACGVARERIVALTPGVDTAMFYAPQRDPAVWATLGADPTIVKVLYVGRLSVEKNPALLASVWKQVRSRLGPGDPRTELVIIGDGPHRAAMEREFEGMGASFLGFRHGAELAALYASSDLFVFPSVTDTLGQVVMEAQASGLPVLVSDRGGPKEVVRDGHTGFVLPASDPGRWADRIVELVCDPERRRAMGADAHLGMQSLSIERSFEHFWNVHAQAWREHRAGIGVPRVLAGAFVEARAGEAAETARKPESVGAAG